MLKRKITEQDLVNQIGDYSIFTHYFGKFRIGDHYRSVFDKDDKPSTGFYVTPNGRIIYNDFRSSEKWSVVRFVQQLYGLNYFQAINKIAEDFGLKEGTTPVERIAPVIRNQPKQKKEKIIEITKAKWTDEYLDFWKKYHIDVMELNENKIIPVSSFKINDTPIPYQENNPKYALLFDDIDDSTYVKIYSPYDKPEYKWITNGYNDIPYGINQLPYLSDTLIISKSQKDRIVLKKFFTDVISFQNESKGAYNYGKIEHILAKYKHILIWFDNDAPGIKALNFFKEEGFNTYHLPEHMFENNKVKDPADFVKEWGVYEFEVFLKQNNLLNG